MRVIIFTFILCNGAVVNALDLTTLETLGSTTFSYTGANQTYSFPDETVYLKVQLGELEVVGVIIPFIWWRWWLYRINN